MNEYDKQVFANNLNRLIQTNNKKQSDLCKLLNVSKSTVSSWCNAQKIPRMDKIETLAMYFNVKKSDLIEEKEYTYSSDNISEKKNIFINKIISLDEDTVDRYLKILDLLDKED